MRRLTWLTLGLFAFGCGGQVVGMMDSDGSTAVEIGPPQRGASDGAAIGEVVAPPPPPVDAAVDLGRSTDVPIDRPVVVVDAGPPDVPPVVIACQVANNSCPAGTYCLSANCTTCTCVAAPAASDVEAPVCGCDRLTYWNLSLAVSHAVSVRTDGACPAGLACGGVAGTDCPTGALCNLEQANAVGCNLNSPAGRCWVLPATCPAAGGVQPTTRRCGGNNTCQTVCALITAGRSYFTDLTCP
jgi:hypothetical protein